jgi:hypothetical protein
MGTVLGHLGPAKELFSTGKCVNVTLDRVAIHEVKVKGPFDEADEDLLKDYFYRFRYNFIKYRAAKCTSPKTRDTLSLLVNAYDPSFAKVYGRVAFRHTINWTCIRMLPY